MNNIGPQLPPHLARKIQEATDSDSSDDGCGPQLPSVACRGPAPSLYGPAPPPRPAEPTCIGPRVDVDDNAGESSSDSDDGYGPALPPQFNQKVVSGDNNRGSEPNHHNPGQSDSDSDDGGMIGPTLGEKTQVSTKEDIAREIELRAKRMKDRLEGKDVKEVQRESWMLELPEEKANSFGLGARQFSRKGLPEKGKDRSAWTDSPAEKERKLREGVVEGEEAEEPFVVNMRDQEMEKVASELRHKRGVDSLMNMHEKKMNKKKKEDLANGEISERRPFDRDIDLQANRFDEAVKKNMLKSAAKINDRFSSGNQKFL